MNTKVVLLVTLFLFALSGMVAAQATTDTDVLQSTLKSPVIDDPGIPDTITFPTAAYPAGTLEFTVPVILYNDEDLGGFNLPMSWDSPDITCDSVSFVGTRIEYVNTKLFSIDNANRRLQAGMIIFFEESLHAGTGLIYTAYFSVNPSAADQVINIDSTFYPPAGNFALTTDAGQNFIPQVIPGAITLGEPQTDPTIALDPSLFSFGAIEGGSNPDDQSLTITNIGAGTLEWTASNTSGWLTLNPTSGTGDGSVTLSVNITGLSAGTYYDTVTVSDPSATNDPQQAVVTLVIDPPPPTIVLNPTSFTYTVTEGDVLPDDQLSVTNSGGGTLDWTAGDVSGWLTLNPTSGVGDGTITMSFNIAALSPGIYYDTITVSDPNATNDPQKATIMLTVEELPPAIVLDPTSFSYTITEGDAIPDDQLSITNGGGGVLNWTASNVTGWLTLNPASGSGDGTVTLSFDVTGVSEGTYYDTITVSDPAASNDPQQALVTVVIEPPPPTIALSPTEFNYAVTEGNNLPDDQLTITNTGGGTLDWAAGNYDVWLSLNPISGVGDATVTLSFDVSGLGVGGYRDTIVVSDPNATNSPQYAYVNVTVNAMPIPVISVSPASFTFDATEGGGNPAAQTLKVDNIGDGTLDWTASYSAGWLAVDPTTGSDGDSSAVSVDITGLAPGMYIDTITITDPMASNSPVYVPVTLNIEALPIIVLDPTSFDFTVTEGDLIPTQTLMIHNGGGGSLSWTASNLTAWLTLNPTSGGDADTLISLDFDISGVPAGTYYDTITVTDPTASNSPQTVPVTLTINPPAAMISLDPTLIQLGVYEGESIADTQINITNTGGGVLDWTAFNQTSWISIDPASGTGDGTITLSFNITGVGPGTYYDTVFVSDPAAANDPQYTVVELTVYGTDRVEIETVNAFPGEQVVVGVNYVNATTTWSFSLPLTFDPVVVVCDSVSFIGTRIIGDESTVTIDNVSGSVLIYGFTIGGAIVGPGSGLIAKLYFTVDAGAAAQFMPIDSGDAGPFEFTADMSGTPKETEFYSGGIDITDTPCFDFPTDTVTFEFDLGGVVPSISFPITNTCGGILEWTVTDGADWLVMSPTSGTQDDSVTFDVDTTGLVPGFYETTATFESNGINTPYTVVVILNLRAIPIISLDPDHIDLGQVCGGDTITGTFGIENSGHGTLEWTATSIEAVDLSDYSGTAPSTVTYTILTELLDYGHHMLEVEVLAANSLNSPQTLTIQLFIIDCDACTFDIADVNGDQGLPVGVPIYTNGIIDVAGLQFNIGYDPAVMTPDSVTSDYMTNPTIGFSDNQIHYVWDDIVNPITVPEGNVIMTLWVTVIGDIGLESCFEWTGVNEITDIYGIPYEGVTYCGGCLTVVSPFYSMSGSIGYYDFVRPVPGVTVDVSGDAFTSTTTDENGDFVFHDLSAGSYTLTPSRADDDAGVSVGDAIKIRRHIAFVEEFDSPYKMIAADINLNNDVSVADVVLIRRYLAELEPLASGNWAFVDADFAAGMENWYDAPKYIDALISNKDLELLDFVGIRMGDVNNTWSYPVMARLSGLAVELSIPEIIVAPSDDIAVPIVVANFNAVAGVEIHVTYDMAQTTIDSITSPVMPDPTVNSVNGRAHIIWEDFLNPITLPDGETLAVIHFHIMPTASGDLPLEFMANCELTDEIGDPYPLTTFGGKLVVEPLDVDDDNANLPLQFELKQNYPNPFNPSTTISYTVDKAMDLVFEVYNVSGQVVERIDLGRKTAGTYSFTYHGGTLASGIYTYRLVGEGISMARQMMLVK